MRKLKVSAIILLRLLSNMTFQRLLNYIFLQTGYLFSMIVRTPYQWGMPISISIEPTTACNLQCPECPAGTLQLNRKGGVIRKDLLKKILDEMANRLIYLILYFQGEPYLHKNFLQLVGIAKKYRLFVATSTNGHYLDDENSRLTVASGIDKIIVSLDGTDATTYSKYRKGGDYEKVIAGIQSLVRWKKGLHSTTPVIVVQFIVFNHNEHQVEDIKKLGYSLGADLVEIKTAQHNDFKNGNPLMTSIDGYSRYRKTSGGEYILKGRMTNRCHRMWTSCVFTWDGKVLPCCYDKDALHSFGAVDEKKVKEIWYGPMARNFRKRFLRDRKTIGMCNNCTEGV